MSKNKSPSPPRNRGKGHKTNQRNKTWKYHTSSYATTFSPGRLLLHHVLAKSPDLWCIASPSPSRHFFRQWHRERKHTNHSGRAVQDFHLIPFTKTYDSFTCYGIKQTPKPFEAYFKKNSYFPANDSLLHKIVGLVIVK